MPYYLAINAYRSSKDNGFYNSWFVYEVASRAQQADILRNGLDVRDQCGMDRTPCRSTKGIRTATAQERREYNSEIERVGQSARRYLSFDQ